MAGLLHLSPSLVAGVIIGSSPATADTLRVPDDYAFVREAAAVAVSGDSILVGTGFHWIDAVITIRSGVTLAAAGARDSTTLEMIHDGERFVLSADGPDSTIVEGFTFLIGRDLPNVALEVETPASAIRGNFFAGSGRRAVVRLHDGGLVEHNVFADRSGYGIEVVGGVSDIRYNLWNAHCYGAEWFGIAVVPSKEGTRATVRNNTMRISTITIDSNPAPQVEFVNNIFVSVEFDCTGYEPAEPNIWLHHNLFLRTDYFSGCEGDTLMGPGNIDWGTTWNLLFCEEDECLLNVHSDSQVVGAGEHGETLGARPIGCGDVPIDSDPEIGTPAHPERRLGLPRPNPMSSGTRLPLAAGVDMAELHLEVYDAAGRLVRRLGGERTPSIAWDGTDSGGEPVAPGVYYLRSPLFGEVRTVRVVR